MLVNKGNDTLGLFVEEITVEEMLPGGVRLLGLVGQYLEQLFEALL